LANDGGGGKNALTDARIWEMEIDQTQMSTQQLMDTARALVADDKGLLAMDESNPTCNKRFAKLACPRRCSAGITEAVIIRSWIIFLRVRGAA